MFYKKKQFFAIICLLVLLALPLLYISLKKNGGGATTRSSEKIELVPHKNFEATLLSYTPIIKVNKDFENAPFNINNYDTAVLTLIYSNYSQQDYKNIQATLHV